jgi:cytochrome c biogenesis protein CcdA
LFGAGSVLGALSTILTLALIGALAAAAAQAAGVDVPVKRCATLLLLFLTAGYAGREMGWWRLPVPGRSWQVPRTWATGYRGRFVFGLLLGMGWVTRTPYPAFYVVLLWSAVAPMLWNAVALATAFGVGRTLPLAVVGVGRFLDRPWAESMRAKLWLDRHESVFHEASGIGLIALTAAVLADWLTSLGGA